MGWQVSIGSFKLWVILYNSHHRCCTVGRCYGQSQLARLHGNKVCRVNIILKRLHCKGTQDGSRDAGSQPSPSYRKAPFNTGISVATTLQISTSFQRVQTENLEVMNPNNAVGFVCSSVRLGSYHKVVPELDLVHQSQHILAHLFSQSKPRESCEVSSAQSELWWRCMY